MSTPTKNGNMLFILLCFFSLLCITFILVPTTLQNDTFYTIKVGERIAIEGFTQIDNFTFLEGIPYHIPPPIGYMIMVFIISTD